MYGFDAFGAAPFGSYAGDVFLVSNSQSLTLSHVIDYQVTLVTFGNQSDNLNIRQNVSVDTIKNIYDVLTIVQSNAAAQAHTINVSVNDTLSIVQTVNAINLVNNSDVLTIVQSNTATHSNLINQTDVLSIVQTIGFQHNNAINAVQTLTLVQAIQPTQTIAQSQSLTLAQTNTVDAWKNTNQTLSLVQVVAYNQDNVVNLAHVLTINQLDALDTPNTVAQNLIFVQVVSTGIPYNFSNSHTLVISHSVSVSQTTIVSQPLSIVQTVGLVRSNNITTTHALSINQTNTYSNSSGSVSQSLVFIQGVVCVTPGSVFASNFLVFNQNTVVGTGTPVTHNLNIVQTLGYLHNVPGPFTNTLVFVQQPQFTRDIYRSHTLTITQTNLCQVPFNISVNQTLTLTDTNKFSDNLNNADVLGIVQTVSAIHNNVVSIHDTLLLAQSGDEGTILNGRHKLTFVQVPKYEIDVNPVTQTLSISQLVKFVDQIAQSDALTITPTLATVTKYNTPVTQQLVLVQTPTVNTSYNLYVYQTISPKQSGNLYYVNFFMMCQCIDVVQSVTNAVPVFISQNINFTWTEKDVQYQTLNIQQYIETNFDDSVNCCNPNGANTDRDNTDAMLLTHHVACAMLYNVNVQQALNVRMSATWRP